MIRAVTYARVSTNEQAEYGFSLDSQLAACREYADRNDLTIVDEISDSHTGTKLGRPGLKKVRDQIKKNNVDAVIVHSPDRLTRKLGHSLLLREECKNAGIDLHYCNRGKFEETPESRMTQNIEAVFSDYWREKIIESSKRGRRQKARNGQWPCDGHAPYGYKKLGKGREAKLEIDDEESAIIRRMFDLYVGPLGKPMNYQAIAKALTSEGVPPPNRGIGMKKPGKAWSRTTVRKVLTRRAYIGEFSYGGIAIDLPDLVIVETSTFEAAQKRREDNKARSSNMRKYDFLLAGHMLCSCGLGMSVSHMKQGRYRYYACNSITNKKHYRECTENRIRAADAETVSWNWVVGLLLDEDSLNRALRKLIDQRSGDSDQFTKKLDSALKLKSGIETRIDRITDILSKATDDYVSASLDQKLDSMSRERQALVAEEDSLRAELATREIGNRDISAIHDAAAEIRRKLADPTFEQRRAVLDVLDLQVQLKWREEQRGIKCTCGLRLKSEGKRIPTWKPLSRVAGKLSSTTTTSPPTISSLACSSVSSN